MQLIQDKDRVEIQKRFQDLKAPVTIVFFTQEMECAYCKDTHQLLEELASLSDKITLKVYDFVKDKTIADQYGIDKIPAAIIMGEKDYGIRFYGIPSGYEFSTLLEDLLMVSRRDSGLAPATREALKDISTPLRLQVFVTPTCPYCPRAVFLAHQFAMESEHIVADGVEATEYPHLSVKYSVRGVPKTVGNDKDVAEGAIPEAHLLQNVLSLVQQSAASLN